LDGDTPEVLIRHADSAMFAAKEAGRNACRFFSGEAG
jgi:PleD family two-component response regulator